MTSSDSKVGAVRVGTMGWNYDEWSGPFYPSTTRTPEFLSTYARAFDTVEVDSTFYAIPPLKTVRAWADRTPAHFRFALKLPQEITHVARLRGNSVDVARQFFDRARELEDKLGPVLMQLGPDFGPAELPALARFLPELPSDVPVAVEFRHRGWITDGVIALLAEHGVALALTEARWIPRRQMLALAERPTADFTYVRLLGPNRDIVDYSRIQVDRTRELEAWAAAIHALAARLRTVYAFLNNHFAGHAPASARDLQHRLGQPVVTPDQLGEQFSLF